MRKISAVHTVGDAVLFQLRSFKLTLYNFNRLILSCFTVFFHQKCKTKTLGVKHLVQAHFVKLKQILGFFR